MIIGAAGFDLAAAQPLLSAAVGWRDEDQDEVRRRCVGTMVALIAALVREESGEETDAGRDAPAGGDAPAGA